MNNRLAIVSVVIAIVLAGAWYYLGGSSSGLSSAPSTKEFTLEVAGSKLVSGESTLKVRKGDTVIIRVTSDAEEEFHLHGYDRSIDLAPGVENTLTFMADASGRFEYELEHSKTELGFLEVQP